MSSTSSRFPAQAAAGKFPHITMKFSLLDHQDLPGELEDTLVDERPLQDLPIIHYWVQGDGNEAEKIDDSQQLELDV